MKKKKKSLENTKKFKIDLSVVEVKDKVSKFHCELQY